MKPTDLLPEPDSNEEWIIDSAAADDILAEQYDIEEIYEETYPLDED